MQQVHITSLLFGGVIVAIVAGGEVVYELWVKRQEAAVRAWPETSCTIISSEVEVHRDVYNPPDTFELHLSYRYRADGGDYTSDRYHISGNWMASYDHAFQTAAALIPGTEVRCYYNPADPSLAILSLEPRFGVRRRIVSTVICLAGIAAFGTGLFFKLFR